MKLFEMKLTADEYILVLIYDMYYLFASLFTS